MRVIATIDDPRVVQRILTSASWAVSGHPPQPGMFAGPARRPR